MNVWEIKDLRTHIFSFLRNKPNKQCCQCKTCIQWDPNTKHRIRFVSYHYQINKPPTHYCMNCLREHLGHWSCPTF